MLLGGNVILRGACGKELSDIVAGGPIPKPAGPGPGGGGTAPAGAVSCQSRAAPAG